MFQFQRGEVFRGSFVVQDRLGSKTCPPVYVAAASIKERQRLDAAVPQLMSRHIPRIYVSIPTTLSTANVPRRNLMNQLRRLRGALVVGKDGFQTKE